MIKTNFCTLQMFQIECKFKNALSMSGKTYKGLTYIRDSTNHYIWTAVSRISCSKHPLHCKYLQQDENLNFILCVELHKPLRETVNSKFILLYSNMQNLFDNRHCFMCDVKAQRQLQLPLRKLQFAIVVLQKGHFVI